MFLHLRGRAYKGYLEVGRGILLGPFLSDDGSVFRARIVGAPGNPSGMETPRAVYYREFLEHSTDRAGLVH